MDRVSWTKIWFYGSILITVIVCFILLHKKRIKELLPVGLFIATVNYTVEALGLHFKLWHYPLSNPGYVHIVILSSLVYFPMISMLFAQYLTHRLKRNILLLLLFLGLNIINEVITLKTTDLFIYGEKMNLFITSLLYLAAYLSIVVFLCIYNKLSEA